jgi:hypothetical protein
MADQPWIGSFITDVFKEGDVVTSLNYDCVFEGVMDLEGKWTPSRLRYHWVRRETPP